MDAMSLGLLSLSALLVSAWSIFNKKSLCGIFGSIVAAIMTVFTGASWKTMLMESGKDTALLGFNSYPAAAVILVLFFMTAAVLLTVSAASIIGNEKR